MLTVKSRKLGKDEKDEKDEIDDLLSSAIDMDQVVLSEAELLDASPGRSADFGNQTERLKKSAKKNAELLNSAHARLRLGEGENDEDSNRDS
jgi:hypothetical protein